jgi:flagellar motor switch protein FliN
VNADVHAELTALVSEVASAIGSLVKGTVEVGPGAMTQGRQWIATLGVEGEHPGVCRLAIGETGALSLGTLVSGSAGDDASIGELLRGLVAKVIAALAARPADERVELSLTALEPAAGLPPAEGTLVCAITVPGLPEPLVVAARLEEPAADAHGDRASADGGAGSRIDVILDIDLPVVVRFGHTELPIRALSRLGPGSVIDLGRSPDDPVEVLVSNRVVARGEVVIVGGNYGVRILDVASRSERARSMEA